jgi:hypothetical protein
MKTLPRIIAALLIMALLLNLFGCYGSFALTKKVYNLNGSLGDKFMKSIVMWIFMILPVYEAAGFIDLTVLNTIEFWTGSNPMAMQDGIQNIKYASSDGKTYKVVISKNNIEIEECVGPDTGKSVNIGYSPNTGDWTMNDGNAETVLAKINQDNLRLFYPNGTVKDIKLAK